MKTGKAVRYRKKKMYVCIRELQEVATTTTNGSHSLSRLFVSSGRCSRPSATTTTFEFRRVVVGLRSPLVVAVAPRRRPRPSNQAGVVHRTSVSSGRCEPPLSACLRGPPHARVTLSSRVAPQEPGVHTGKRWWGQEDGSSPEPGSFLWGGGRGLGGVRGD